MVLKAGILAGEELKQKLKDFVKDKPAPYKYPRWLQFVPELPKTATGKIQRFRLRDLPREEPSGQFAGAPEGFLCFQVKDMLGGEISDSRSAFKKNGSRCGARA